MYKYNLYYPAGNTTALVFTNSKEYKKINDEILNKHKDVEQVGFINDNTLTMAGGEICFNALRCAAKVILKNSNTSNNIVKLNEVEYECGIINSNFIEDEALKNKYKNEEIYFTKIPNNAIFTKLSDFEYSVDLGEIFHIIYTKKLDLNSINLKDFAYKYFEEHSLLDKKAVGFMYIEDYNLHPIVRVRDIDTLFYESACGSGSFASFLYFNKIFGKTSIALKQPSNEYIFLKEIANQIEICSIVKDL